MVRRTKPFSLERSMIDPRGILYSSLNREVNLSYTETAFKHEYAPKYERFSSIKCKEYKKRN